MFAILDTNERGGTEFLACQGVGPDVNPNPGMGEVSNQTWTHSPLSRSVQQLPGAQYWDGLHELYWVTVSIAARSREQSKTLRPPTGLKPVHQPRFSTFPHLPRVPRRVPALLARSLRVG
jgi:hypothetical protein